jgi:hypothetical protein
MCQAAGLSSPTILCERFKSPRSSPLAFDNPMRLAEEVAMLDHLSRGRVAEVEGGPGHHREGVDRGERHL